MSRKFYWLMAGVLTLCFGNVVAQTHDVSLSARLLRNIDVRKKGDVVNLISVTHRTEQNPNSLRFVENYYLRCADSSEMKLPSKVGDCLAFDYSEVGGFWDAQVIRNVLPFIVSKGYLTDMRNEIEGDVWEYITRLQNYGLQFKDPLLESYICGLMAKILPHPLLDDRPTDLNLFIEQSTEVNAYTFPNGTIVLTTGLLAALHTEDELVAVLAHEIAHYVLDHSITNVSAEITRQRRAEFWSTLLLGVTAGAEMAVAASNEYYVPGMATVGMAIASGEIASKVIDRLGMKYNQEQENEADRCAVEVLELLNYDADALSTALKRIAVLNKMERNTRSFVASSTHPELLERIRGCGTPRDVRDKRFERMVSSAVSCTAVLKYNVGRLRFCEQLLSQNVANGVADVDDYLLKARCLMSRCEMSEVGEEVLSLLERAGAMDSLNLNVYSTEILARLRLQQNTEAREYLSAYIVRLEEMVQLAKDKEWIYPLNYIMAELQWARKTQLRLLLM